MNKQESQNQVSIIINAYKEKTMEEKDKAKAPKLTGQDYSGKRFGYKLPDGYEFDCIENNEIILKPIKPNYPKTYKECCGILGMTYYYPDIRRVSIDENLLYSSFIELIRCRDAYWKLYGEQTELNKFWKPDWKNIKEIKYCICTQMYTIQKTFLSYSHTILAFPTEEMRDAFYENFKKLIEKCKELL